MRKAGGVYYTPDYIVRYIVKHTVGEQIKGQTPEQISSLRFADIACGSGSFLLGVFDELLDYHRSWFNAHPAQAKKYGCGLDADGVYQPPLHLKREILLNNVYGVDIDAQAVEVAQLSLYLKLLEEETTHSAYQYGLDYQEPLLPSLGKNMVCGNSLVGRDIYETDFFADTNNSAQRKLNAMDYAAAFPQVMRAGGFDAVVGNPPYVRQEGLGKAFKSYAQAKYITYASTADLYTYFIEQAHKIMTVGASFGYIVSNKFMRANYGKALREFLATQSTLRQLIDFGELPVFADAATFPLIITTQKPKAKVDTQSFTHAAIKRLDFDTLDKEVALVGNTLDNGALGAEGWSLASAAKVKLLAKIKAAGIPLGDYVGHEIYRGVLTGFNEAFVIDAQTRDALICADKKAPNSSNLFCSGTIYGIMKFAKKSVI